MRPSRFRGGLALMAMVGIVAAGCSKSTTPTGGGTPSASTGAVTKDATIAAEVPSAIAAKGTLTVATDPSYAPNEFVATDNKTIVGWDIELGNAIGKVMGLKFNFVKAGFDGILAGLQSGKYDLSLSSFTDNKEREKTVDMITYFSAGTSFYTKAGGPTINTLDDLCGHKVAVEKGTTQLDDSNAQNKKCTTAGKPKVSVLAFPDQNGANLALSSGRADVAMADSPVAAYQVKLNSQFALSGQPYGVAPYGIPVPRPVGTAPGSAPMSKPILDALKKLIDTGVYLQILKKWGVQSGANTNPVINGAKS
jgi:polar amino acid transport system substrate-binding protein